jgi:hypothetical protein
VLEVWILQAVEVSAAALEVLDELVDQAYQKETAVW